jgi:protein phosphatase 2C
MRTRPKPEFTVAMDLRRMTLDSGHMTQLTVTKTKSARLKRLKVRRLKYTCRTKTHVEEEKQLDENKKEISLSLSSSAENKVVLSCQRDSPESFTAHGSVSVIGRRREMEDTVRVELGFRTKRNNTVYDFFGVYDGHGGPHVARECEERLHGVMVEEVR